MRIIAVSTLKLFWSGKSEYQDAEEATMAWYREAVKADWSTPSDVKQPFGNASVLKDGRVVFNIAGNKYRLVVWINYPYRVVYIRFIGTHRQYDQIDAQTIRGAHMNIRPIKTEADYRATLREIEMIMSAEAGTEAGDRLDVLTTLVEAYERNHFPMDLPEAVAAIKFRMEQQGLTVDDLVPAIGRKNRVYEVLAGRRPLTIRMIQALNQRFNIPAESLINQRLAPKAA